MTGNDLIVWVLTTGIVIVFLLFVVLHAIFSRKDW